MKLPNEVLALIIGALAEDRIEEDRRCNCCLHGDMRPVSQKRHKATTRQLAQLCRVSRACYYITQPLLYNRVRLFGDDVLGFVRTMGCRQGTVALDTGVRRLVRDLSFEFQPGEGRRWDLHDCHPDPETYLGCRNVCIAAFGEDVDTEAWPTSPAAIAASSAPEGWPFDEKKWQSREDVAVILLFWLPNLNRLELAFEPEPLAYADCGIWMCDSLLNCMSLPYHYYEDSSDVIDNIIPAGLKSLQELVVENSFDPPQSIDPHCPDFDFWPAFRGEKLWLSPSLKKFSWTRVCGHDGSFLNAMSNVESLTLRDAGVSPNTLQEMLRGFPRLRSLHYELTEPINHFYSENSDLTADAFDTSQLVEAVAASCPQLVELYIACFDPEQIKDEHEGIIEEIGQNNHFLLDGTDTSMGEEYFMARTVLSTYFRTIDLRPFTKLTSAVFHMTAFVGWSPNWSRGLPVDTPRIAHRIPQSLQKLELWYDPVSEGCGLSATTFDHVIDLISDCGQPHPTIEGETTAPALRELTIWIPEEWNTLVDHCYNMTVHAAKQKNIEMTWYYRSYKGMHEE